MERMGNTILESGELRWYLPTAEQAPPLRRLQHPCVPDGRTISSTARVAEDASGLRGLEAVCCTNS
jgi:hypothetical protein